MATTGHESEVINVGRLKETLQGVNDLQQKCITLSSLPQDWSALLTYTVTDPLTQQAVTKQFKVGDRVVVTDAENGDEDYDNLVVYTLLKLTGSGNNQTALWAPGGAGGGGGSATGKIRVALTALVNGSQADPTLLNGVTVTLRNTTDDVQVGTTQTWAGSEIVFSKLTPLKAYRVTVSAKSGFQRSMEYQDVASLDIAGDTTKTFQFSALQYTVEMTSNQDVVSTPDADVDRTASGVYLTGQYTYGGSAVAFGSQLHHGDTVLIPADVDTSTISITGSSNVTGYAKAASVDTTSRKLIVSYQTTKVYLTASSSRGSEDDAMIAALSGFTVNGDAVTHNDNTSYVKVPTGQAIIVGYPSQHGYGVTTSGGGTATGTQQTVSVLYTYGMLTIELTTSDNDDADLQKAKVYITIDGGTEEELTGTIASHVKTFQKSVVPGQTYSLRFGAVAGYDTPSAVTSATMPQAGTQTVTKQYATTIHTVNIQTNQSSHTDISATQVSISDGTNTTQYTGAQTNQTLKVPASVTLTAASITAPSVSGYSVSKTVSGTNISVVYSTTILTVNLTSDTAPDNPSFSGVTITVTDTTASATIAAQQNGTYKIPTGHGYSVAVSDDVEGYKAPATATGTASGASASVTMTYEEQAGFVDLGLPSGLKWAQANIVKDAQGNYAIGDNPEDYGCYFSWGNIVGHNNGEGYDFGTSISGPYASTPGNQVSANIASNDAQHDAALALLGSPWRLPTKEEFQELYDNTDREWTTINGVNGWKFMKKTDHSVYVFFPAAGYGSGSSISNVGSYGLYWSSSWFSANGAYDMYFNSSSVNPQIYNDRFYGSSVRAVQ